MRFGLRGETQISNELTGYGQWEYQAALNKTESDDANNFTRVGFAGLKYDADNGRVLLLQQKHADLRGLQNQSDG